MMSLLRTAFCVWSCLNPYLQILLGRVWSWCNFWQVYYVYGFMLLVFVILLIVTICVTIVGTYFLLNAENYHWQWTSFFSAASTALYVYLYSIYYYHVKTKMSGFFQTSFYFGYTLMFCLGLGILCGKFSFLTEDCAFAICGTVFSFDISCFLLLWFRCYWVCRVNPVCKENLQKYQMWLNSCYSLAAERSYVFSAEARPQDRLMVDPE